MLAARLADARFFWEQDLKVPLEEQAKKLDGIVFHEKLGTVADKVERVAKLARWLVEEGIVKGADADQVERAARLAKADLVTGMVGEFPELQGVIGGYLAEAQGEPQGGRRRHPRPLQAGRAGRRGADRAGDGGGGAGGQAGYALSASSRSTRSRPARRIRSRFAGPRSASIELIVDNGLRLSTDASRARQRSPIEPDSRGCDAAHRLDRPSRILDFFADRLKVQQREAGVRHDLIDAVFALGGEDDLVRLLARVKALQAFVETEEGSRPARRLQARGEHPQEGKVGRQA